MLHWFIKNLAVTHCITMTLSVVGVILHIWLIDDSMMTIVSAGFLSFAATLIYTFAYLWPTGFKFIKDLNVKNFGENSLLEPKAQTLLKGSAFAILICTIGFFFQKPEAYMSIAGACGLFAGSCRKLNRLETISAEKDTAPNH